MTVLLFSPLLLTLMILRDPANGQQISDPLEHLTNSSILLSTAKELMHEDGRPASNVIRRVAAHMSQAPDSPLFRSAEGIGMTAVGRLPQVQAARMLYHGARAVGQAVAGH